MPFFNDFHHIIFILFWQNIWYQHLQTPKYKLCRKDALNYGDRQSYEFAIFPLFLLKLIKIYIEVYLVSQYYELGVGPDSLNDISRPVPFHDFTLFVVLSLFSRVVLPTEAENILPAMGNRPWKERGQQIMQNHEMG